MITKREWWHVTRKDRGWFYFWIIESNYPLNVFVEEMDDRYDYDETEQF